MAKGKSANPADAFRKAQRKKELKKNKEQRVKTRDFALVKKDTSEIDDEIQKLESTPGSDQNRLKELKKELESINKKKEEYVAEHPEQRKLVYRPRKSHRNEDEAGPQPAQKARNLFDKRGLPRRPERSIYYDPILNPYGVAPPGLPYVERPLLPGEKDSDAEASDNDSDDDIVMPAAPPPPVEEDSDDDIPMPEGPPPGQALSPPLPPGPPPLPPGPIPTYVPPIGFLPPPPGNPFPPPPGMPALPTAFNPSMFIPPPPGTTPSSVSLPPPPPGPPPVASSGHSMLLPPGLPPRQTGAPPSGFAHPPFSPSMSSMPSSFASGSHLLPPPPGFFPRRSHQPGAIQDPLSSIPHQTYQAHRAGLVRGHPSLPPNPGMNSVPSGTATITAEPELRDFKKEATTFVPPSLKRKKMGVQSAAAASSKINAAPSLGLGDESVKASAVKPDLLDALKDQFGPRQTPTATATVTGGQAQDDYGKFAADMADLLDS